MEKFKSLGNRTSLSKTVEAQIEEAIRTRKFQPGDRLPTEQELCAQFGVSRTVVREAAHMGRKELRAEPEVSGAYRGPGGRWGRVCSRPDLWAAS